MQLKKSQAEAFVRELQALTEKYNVVITGCGCCESPWLEHLDDYDAENSIGSKELDFKELDFEDGRYVLHRAAHTYAKEGEQ